MATFDFCPNSQVAVTLPRENANVVTMNGWTFTGRPTTPHQRKFRVKLFGLRWYLDTAGSLSEYNTTTDPLHNAARLEEFYSQHEMWLPFDYTHPHRGPMLCRFATPLIVPEGIPNSGGLIEPLEVTLIHHNAGYE